MKAILFKTSFFVTFGVIEYLALTPQHIELVEGFWDKQNHFIAFFVLYILLSLAYKYFSVQKKIALLVFVGVQIEVMQYFIPGRFFSTLDIVADSIGIAIGFVIHRYIFKRWSVS